MSNMSDKDMDKLFQEAAERYDAPFDGEAWKAMDQKIDHASRAGTLGYYGSVTGGIVVLLLISFLVFWQVSNTGDYTPIPSVHSKSEGNGSENITKSGEVVSDVADKQDVASRVNQYAKNGSPSGANLTPSKSNDKTYRLNDGSTAEMVPSGKQNSVSDAGVSDTDISEPLSKQNSAGNVIAGKIETRKSDRTEKVDILSETRTKSNLNANAKDASTITEDVYKKEPKPLLTNEKIAVNNERDSSRRFTLGNEAISNNKITSGNTTIANGSEEKAASGAGSGREIITDDSAEQVPLRSDFEQSTIDSFKQSTTDSERPFFLSPLSYNLFPIIVRQAVPEAVEIPSTETGNALDDSDKDSDLKERAAKLAIKVMVAPDLSSVGFFAPDKPGSNFGAMLEYFVSDRVSINSGVIRSKKIYFADDGLSQYGYGRGSVTPEMERLDAECTVLDIPINFNYYFKQSDRHQFYFSGGFTSYIMLSEDYTIQQIINGRESKWTESYRNKNNHFFGLLNLSVAYEKRLSNNFYFQVEPFLKSPLAGVGEGKVDLVSSGVFFNLKYVLLRASK